MGETPYAETPSGKKRSKRNFCCCGCFLFLFVFIVGGGLSLWLGPSILRGVGLLEPSAEELFAGSKDPVATEAVNRVLDTAGIEGVDAMVIPIAGSEGQLAVFTIHDGASAGGISTQAEAEIFLTDTLRQLAKSNRENDLGIEHVAIDYLGESGENLLAFTAPQSVVEAYANGTISRREFLSQVEVDFSNLISAEELRQLIEEGN
jgi:hypothetical protein